MRNKWLHKAALLAISTLLLAGCSSAPTKEQEKQSTLKVMYSDESYFFKQYGDLFAMKHPNIDVEVVSTSGMNQYDPEKDHSKAFDKLVEKEKPDVIMLNTDNYAKYAADGKLMELDTLIQRDKYNTDTIYPALLDQLKEQGGGKLYGLAPSFYGDAIFYNADLFKKYGVDIPKDGITWQELLDLARRFPTDGDDKSRIYGFGNEYAMGINDLAQQIASTEGLKYINPDTKKVTINTDSWKKVFKQAMDAVESKAIYNPKDGGFDGGTMEEYYKSQLFLMGRMAVTRGNTNILQNIKEAKNAIKDYKPFGVGIVAGPVDPSQPDKSRNMAVNEIFCIRANSENADAAWEFIKFVNGDEFAKIKSRNLSNGLLTRMGYSTEYDGHSLEAFYKLKPDLESNLSSTGDPIPFDFYMKLHPLIEKEIGLVADKQKSIDEALTTIQEEGQAELDQAIKERDAEKGKESESSDQASTGTK
ncbi:ABC transporter substrate-binding protein [Paenibacillus puldeungensis]|uniref:ABC transporter substrate-binding protein n=1 Tax=Paenibacillus puldeungensis TaxID=696536 RepID=A0ABW3S3L2_9BACL